MLSRNVSERLEIYRLTSSTILRSTLYEVETWVARLVKEINLVLVRFRGINHDLHHVLMASKSFRRVT